jgi:putative lumazine-binding protein
LRRDEVIANTTDVEADRQAIVGVVRDYYESWYEGDANRMDRSIHPSLAKRAPMAAFLAFGARKDGDPDALDEDTRQTMVEATGRGIGASRAPTPEDRAIEVVVDDVYNWIASVTVRSSVYHEYLHLVRASNGWKIVNALWQRTIGEGGGEAG